MKKNKLNRTFFISKKKRGVLVFLRTSPHYHPLPHLLLASVCFCLAGDLRSFLSPLSRVLLAGRRSNEPSRAAGRAASARLPTSAGRGAGRARASGAGRRRALPSGGRGAARGTRSVRERRCYRHVWKRHNMTPVGTAGQLQHY